MSSSSCAGMGLFGGSRMRSWGILVRILIFLTIFLIHSLRRKPGSGKSGWIIPRIGTIRFLRFMAKKIYLFFSFCIVGCSLLATLCLRRRLTSGRNRLWRCWWRGRSWWGSSRSWRGLWCIGLTFLTRCLGFQESRRSSTWLVARCCLTWWWRDAETTT